MDTQTGLFMLVPSPHYELFSFAFALGTHWCDVFSALFNFLECL